MLVLVTEVVVGVPFELDVVTIGVPGAELTSVGEDGETPPLLTVDNIETDVSVDE